MASSNVTLENQLQSAQKNLLFLQQDHANTLKGLHAEIRRLQQQCTGEHAYKTPPVFKTAKQTGSVRDDLSILEFIIRTDIQYR